MSLPAPTEPQRDPSPSHTVYFYDADAGLVDALAVWAREGLANGAGLLVIATQAHREELARRLHAGRFAGADRIVFCDAAEARDTVAPHGVPSWDAFRRYASAGLAKARATSAGGEVRAYGEIVDLLWRGGNPVAAVRLEGFWNDLARDEAFSLLCGYCREGLRGVVDEHATVADVCRTHAHVWLPEDPTNRMRMLEADLQARVEGELSLREALRLQQETARALRQSRAELEEFVENAVEGLHWVGPDGTILWANRAELELLGYSKEEYVGRNIAEFHVDGPVLDGILARLRGHQILHNQPARMRAKDGSIRHVLIDSNVRWDGNTFVHTCCFTRDVTDVERARERAAFLSEASVALASSLDVATTLATVSRLAVPRIADGCLIEIAGGVDVEDSAPVVVTEGALPDGRDAVKSLGPEAAISAAMTARGRSLGVISLVVGSSGRRFDAADVAMVEELGRRAGVALDNARLYRDAIAADRRKDEFLAVLGHELRNPLAPILTALQLMQLRGVGGDRERAVIDRQVRHLERLVGDLLDVSRVTRGKLQLRCERVEVSQVIAKAVELASPLLEQRSQRLRMEVPREGLPVHADPVRLSQVLVNLLTNAAKFTDHEGNVSIRARRSGEEILVTVGDDGIGIAPEVLPRIFELFVQGARILDRSQGGLGIGLALAKSLTELHGGRIEARSAGTGKGSEFTIVIPIDRGEVTNPALDVASPPISRVARPMRVLVVDDNLDAADTIAESLRTVGHEVWVANDGPQALRIAAGAHALDVAIVDIGLPVMDGYELARRLRLLPGRDAMRLVAISGYGQESDRRRSAEAGIAEHLTKPVDLRQLLDTIAV